MLYALCADDPALDSFANLLLILLPIVLIGIGLLFSKTIKLMNQNPKAYAIAGVLMGLLYVGPLFDSYSKNKSDIAIIGFGMCVVAWPIIGFIQFRAIKKAKRENAKRKE